LRNFSNKALIAEIWLFEKDVLIFVVEGDEGAGDPACPPELCDGWEAGAEGEEELLPLGESTVEGEGVGAGEEEGIGVGKVSGTWFLNQFEGFNFLKVLIILELKFRRKSGWLKTASCFWAKENSGKTEFCSKDRVLENMLLFLEDASKPPPQPSKSAEAGETEKPDQTRVIRTKTTTAKTILFFTFFFFTFLLVMIPYNYTM
jgi:hypothetical protein